MPYEITQCYLPPGSSDSPAFTPAEAGTWFSDPGGMQGGVEKLKVGVEKLESMQDKMVVTSRDNLPTKDGHLSQK